MHIGTHALLTMTREARTVNNANRDAPPAAKHLRERCCAYGAPQRRWASTAPGPASTESCKFTFLFIVSFGLFYMGFYTIYLLTNVSYLGLRIRIRINFSYWIRIRIQIADPDPQK